MVEKTGNYQKNGLFVTGISYEKSTIPSFTLRIPLISFRKQIRATRSNEILVESDAGTIMAGVSLFHNYELERGFFSFDLILRDVCIRQIVKISVYFGFGQITV